MQERTLKNTLENSLNPQSLSSSVVKIAALDADLEDEDFMDEMGD